MYVSICKQIVSYGNQILEKIVKYLLVNNINFGKNQIS